MNYDKFWSLFNISWAEFEKIEDNVLGLEDELKSTKIYPNPSRELFVFEFEDQIDKESIMIFKISGERMDFEISEYGNNQFIIRHNFSPGFYLMLVKDPDNFYSHKLIIEQ